MNNEDNKQNKYSASQLRYIEITYYYYLLAASSIFLLFTLSSYIFENCSIFPNVFLPLAASIV